MNREIEKYLNKRKVFEIAIFVWGIVVLGCVIIILKDDIFLLYDIIAIAVLMLFMIFLPVYTVILDRQRKKLIDKYYGKVSEEDKIRATRLLNEIETLDDYIYECLDDGRLQGYEDAAKWHLLEIKKGLKLCRKDFDVLKAELEEARAKKDEPADAKYIKYIDEMFELFSANLSDL